MKAQFLEASDVASELPKLIVSCNELYIAMAYVKYRGLKPILSEIHELLDRNGSLYVVFGLSHAFGITDKQAARQLYALSKYKKAKIFRNNNPGFHPKLFIFKGQHQSVLIGSSNITEHAHSLNSEANVLIEDPTSDFLGRVLTFFQDQVTHSTKLTKKDIEQYNPQRSPVKKSTKTGIPLDSLPTSKTVLNEIGDIQNPTIWKIAPGEDACYWSEWFNEIDVTGNGVIAIGWDIGDLNKIKKKDTVEKRVKKQAETVWNIGRDKPVSEWYVRNQLWDFKKIKRGDLVVVYSECRVLGIAKVVEDFSYCYKMIDSLSYEHQVKVQYLWYHPWPRRAKQKIIDSLGKRGTLKLLDDMKIWDFIKSEYFK